MKETVLRTEWGPMIEYDGNTVYVEDINPHHVMRWRLSRWEVAKLGLRLLRAAVTAR